ncbi:MAG: hypothetical protein AAGF56_09995, partial [Pseudomonadota bacterium]
WPTPDLFYSNGMYSLGYAEEVVLPIRIDADQTGDLALSGDILIGICEEICIPVTLSFETLLPEAGAPDAAISAAMAATAVPARLAQVGQVTCQVVPIDDGVRLTAEITMPSAGEEEFVVIETADPTVWVSQAETTRANGELQASVDMVNLSGAPFVVDRSGIRITVLGGTRAIDIRGCSAP